LYGFVENDPAGSWDRLGLLSWKKEPTKWITSPGSQLPSGNRPGGIDYGPPPPKLGPYAFAIIYLDGTFTCECTGKGIFRWKLKEASLVYRPHVFMSSSRYITSTGANVAWVKRCEQDHVNDYDQWALKIGKPLATTTETNQKKKKYLTKSGCVKAALKKFRKVMQRSVIKAQYDSVQKWDVTKKHDWASPNRRP